MTEPVADLFTHTLIDDVQKAQTRLESLDTQCHRRELIRSVFAAIEGLLWQLKQDVYKHADVVANLTIHERAAMLEETYSVDDRGNIQSLPRFLPLETSIRLVVNIFNKHIKNVDVDFSHPGWANLKASINVRNRLVHPKKIDDLSVTNKEVEQVLSGFAWMLSLEVKVLKESNESLRSTLKFILSKILTRS